MGRLEVRHSVAHKVALQCDTVTTQTCHIRHNMGLTECVTTTEITLMPINQYPF